MEVKPEIKHYVNMLLTHNEAYWLRLSLEKTQPQDYTSIAHGDFIRDLTRALKEASAA